MSTGPLSVAQRTNLRLHRLFFVLIYAVVILGAFAPMLDNVDVGWHVAQGRWMVRHLAVYRADVFNYPNLGRPLVDEYPLFQIPLYLSTCLGWWGPCLLCALGYSLLVAILALTARALDLRASSSFALVLGIMLLYLHLAFPLRPHLVTFLGIAAFGGFLLRHREAGTWMRFWPLALLQAVWTNGHGGFVLGPAMVACFGVEMIARRWKRSGLFPWTAVRTWAGAFALVFLGCFVNPFGARRFVAPFYQEHLEAIRAYVGEMQPLNPAAQGAYEHLTLLAAVLIGSAVLLRRGAISYSLLFLAVVFYFEALTMKKAWPVFGVFLPVVMLSTGAFARTTIMRRRSVDWAGLAGHIAVLVPLLTTVMMRLDGQSDGSLRVLWREFDAGRSELPLQAAAWLQSEKLSGRLFHRCEDGGLLQQEELLPTYADTGFGKYSEGFIRETGLVGMRPQLLGTFLGIYRPDFVLCDDFAFQWPASLRQAGCRLVYYSPNSSVWTLPGVRPDLPAVSDAEVEAAFTNDLKAHGFPRNPVLYGRNVIALHSLGLSAFAVAQLTGLPGALRQSGWYWEAARIICFDIPPAAPDLRHQLRAEADKLGDLTAEFRAYDEEAEGRPDAARKILEQLPQDSLSDREAILLLRLDLRDNRPGAPALARKHRLFDLYDGEYWQDRAILEENAGRMDVAAHAWREAVFYAPDINTTLAFAFARRHPETRLQPFLESTAFGRP